MVLRKLLLGFMVLFTLASGFSKAAHAQTVFNFDFSNGTDIFDGNGNPISGTSDATGTLLATSNGDGSYTAISGSATVTGFDAGSYNLVPNPSAPNTTVISNFTYYDDQLFPNQPLQLLDDGGLMFSNSNGLYYNIYCLPLSPDGDTYLFFDSNFSGSDNIDGGFTLTQVPEPGANALLCSLGLTGAALLRGRRAR